MAGLDFAQFGILINAAGFLGMAVVVWIAGVRLANKTGMDQAEMSTVHSAMRAGLYTMAMSDIFGTNLFDISFLFLIDITGGADAVMNSVGVFEGLPALSLSP